jgi:predicted metal-binding membrane protein
MMLAMGVARSMMLFWMVAIVGIVTAEKLAERPRHAGRAGAVVLAAGAPPGRDGMTAGCR